VRHPEGTSPGYALDCVPEPVELDVTQPLCIEFDRDGNLISAKTMPARRVRATKATLEIDRAIMDLVGATAIYLAEKVAALGGVVKVVDGELVAETEPHHEQAREDLVARWIVGDL
jgi:hypothetical protein